MIKEWDISEVTPDFEKVWLDSVSIYRPGDDSYSPDCIKLHYSRGKLVTKNINGEDREVRSGICERKLVSVSIEDLSTDALSSSDNEQSVWDNLCRRFSPWEVV